MMLAKQRSALAQRRLPGDIPILILVLGLPLAGLLFVVAATRLHAPEARSPASKPARSADLVMQDHADGSITVLQAGDRRVIDVLQPATNAFLRVMLTGLVRERRAPATAA